MDISVIVPVYNMAAFIPEGIKSLKEQKGVSMEVVIVNDGSKDDSAAVCERCIRDDARFRLISTENQGAGPARNTGIACATGEYLYFFDIDDHLQPGALCKMVSRAREATCDLLVFGYTKSTDASKTPQVMEFADTVIDGGDARQHYERHMEGPTCIQGAPWNKLFRRDVAVNNHVEYPALRRNQDEVFIMRYMQYAQSVRIVPDVLYHYLANTQERMWLKYRLDYDENVEGLFRCYDETILSWNPENEHVKKILYRTYYTCTLDVLRVPYNPKWKFSPFEIYRRVKAHVQQWQRNSLRYKTDAVDHAVAASKLYPYMLKGHYFMVYMNFAVKALQKAIFKK